MKKLAILGSTGSIGTQTLDVVARQQDFQVIGLAAHSNIALLEQQIRKFKPRLAAVADEALSDKLKISVRDTDTKILSGAEGVAEVAAVGADIVVTAMVGIAGLIPTLAAIDAGSDIALANKETLVTAGKLVTQRAKDKNVRLLPVDSEHGAIFQCLNTPNAAKYAQRIILTASGGPFFGKTKKELEFITPEDALKHPNWDMGNKITIDSATLMNKGLEVIEAKWLFDCAPDQIDVVIHRQSIIHSMVEFSDGSLLAQMGEPDMRTPISYALYYPQRERAPVAPFDFMKHGTLTFDRPDEETFLCFQLAKRALTAGGTMPCFVNGANEVAVSLFLQKKISFLNIGELIETAMRTHVPVMDYTLEDVKQADQEARRAVYRAI